MPLTDPMPLVDPPEAVTVDTGHLHTAIHTVHHAIHDGREPFRYQIVAAVAWLKPFLTLPRILGQTTIDVQAEPLWWVVQAADEIGNDQGLSPVGVLFTAVDELALALEAQAPRTDHAMVAVVEAETTVAFAEAREDHTHE